MFSLFLEHHDLWSFLLVSNSIFLASAICTLAVQRIYFHTHATRSADLFLVLSGLIATLPLSLLYSNQPSLLVLNFAAIIVLLSITRHLLPNHSYAGLTFYIAQCMTMGVGIVWSIQFLLALEVSTLTKILIASATPLLVVLIPSSFLQMFEQFDAVCRTTWKRPRHVNPIRRNDLLPHEPFVSIHVPTYSEPPEIVIKTLDKLHELDYRNYEVLVIDNNTQDPTLWKPVLAHCTSLGKRFRFIHVDDLPGAKGGALNLALQLTTPQANLVVIVDADYHAQPSFLRALVGHFDDPKIGFVQTPHDYRGWRGNLFLTMCYWEYRLFFHTAMVALNEFDAGITVGTMCIIRKKALIEAGGWSETCVTEDSELAIRIHDAGYSSVYVETVFGRGLIPDTFAGYKKQRYRWTAGPVQEFLTHARRFLTFSPDSRFTLRQRLFHLNHGFHNVTLGLSIPLSLIGVATVLSLIAHNEIIAVPFELWLTATILLCASPVLTVLMFKTSLHAGIREYIALLLASRALYHVITYASLRTTFTGNAQWTRTSKFKSTVSYAAALHNTKEEILIGSAFALFIIGAYTAFPHTGLSLMYLIGISYLALSYFAAPLVSIINVAVMRREAATPVPQLELREA